MTTFGVCMARNEADIIGPIVKHMVSQVDHVIVADNLSTDDTRAILDGLPVTVVDDPDPAYRQSEKMTALGNKAHDMGAEWIVPFDADEWWYSPFGRIADVLAGLYGHSIAVADLYDHVPTAVDESTGDPTADIGWRRRRPAPLPKVAVRWGHGLVIEMGNHGAHYTAWTPKTISGHLVVRHFPWRSPQQMVAKSVQGAAALRLTDLPRAAGEHWRGYADIANGSETALHDVFRQWFWSPDPAADPELIFDPAPTP